MRSIANGAARQATVRAATIRLRRSIATASAATSAFGAAQPPTAPDATTAQPASTRSEEWGKINIFYIMLLFIDVMLNLFDYCECCKRCLYGELTRFVK